MYKSEYEESKSIAPMIAINPSVYGVTLETASSIDPSWALLYVDFDGNTVSWYSSSSPDEQKNGTGDTYVYFAIG